MHKKHRPHRHHRESKHRHVSTPKKNHSHGHKHHGSHRVSFQTPKDYPKPDNHACGDFERKPPNSDEKKPSRQEGKQRKIENYLRELTQPQQDYVTKHTSLDRGENKMEYKREKSFGDSLPNPTNTGAINHEPKKKMEDSTEHKHKHRRVERHSKKHESSERKHHKEINDSCEQNKKKHHEHKILGCSHEKKCKGKVQEVLFYQISPKSYGLQPEKTTNEIEDLYRRGTKGKSQERKSEKSRGHSSKLDAEHRIQKERRVRSTEKDSIERSRAHETIEKYRKNPTRDVVNSKEKKPKGKLETKPDDEHATEEVANEYVERKEHGKQSKMKKSVAERSFQQKIENDMKNYFSKIQKMIDKKLELILNNKPNLPITQKVEESDSRKQISPEVKPEPPVEERKVIDSDKKDHRPRRHKFKEDAVTFEEIKKEKRVHKRRESKESPKINVQNAEPIKPQFCNPPQMPFLLLSTEGLSNMPSDQSKITNRSYRQLDPPYEWIFPPELWNLKMQELILASQKKQLFVPPALSKQSSGDLLRQKHRTNIKSNFLVQGVEPPRLDRSSEKVKKKERKLECKTVSVIGIQPHAYAKELRPTNEIFTQKTPNSASDELVEKRKRSKRFKIYYKYSVEDNAQHANDLVSLDGKSVVSDSYRIVSDPCDEETLVTNKTKTFKQELVQNINIKPVPKTNKNCKTATPVQSVLNNIVEEPSTSVTQCYFKGFISSNSESCLKINKKSAHSSISVRQSKPPVKKICKYCRPKSDVTIPSRAASRIHRSKSEVVLDSSNKKKMVLTPDDHSFLKLAQKNFVKNNKIICRECQTSDHKVSDEEERKFELAYNHKKEQFKEIYKTLEHLENGIQTVSQNHILKKVFVDAAVGSETILENTHKKVLENKEVTTESSYPNKRNKVKVKDIATGESTKESPEIVLKSTACSPICIRGPKSPVRRQQKTPGSNDVRQNTNNLNAPRRTRKVDTSPPKPVPRQSIISKPVYTRKPVIPPTQVIVLRDTSTNKECTGTQNEENTCDVVSRKERTQLKTTPRCSRGKDVSRPQSVRQPSNVEELLRGVADGRRLEKVRKEVSVGDGDTKNCMREKVRENQPISKQTRSTARPTPRTTPISRQNTNVEKKPNTVNKSKDESSNDADVEGCVHVFNPRDRTPAVKTGELEARCFSVNRAELENRNSSKKMSGSTSSSVSDTAIQTRVENREEPRRSKSLVDIGTYRVNTAIPQEPQIYSHTEAILATQRIKTRLEKFTTEPQSRWYRTKSNDQSLDQYDEKFKSTMLLTKQDKSPGPSSYQKRKIYDAFRRQKLKNSVQSNLPQQVYYNINNIVDQENLYNFDHKKNVILENFANRKHSLKTARNSVLETTMETKENTPDSSNALPKKSSIITLFVNKYRDANHGKLFYFYQKLLQVSSSLEFPFNLTETCSCKEISENCQACLNFVNNLGTLFTEATLSYHRNDMSGFADNYNNLTINIDNEVFDFYNNEEFNCESVIDDYSVKSDDHDSVTAKIFDPDDIQQETMSKICRELLPGRFCEQFFAKSKYYEKCDITNSSDPSSSLTKPTSCPVLQDNKADFEYLYDENESSSSKETAENIYTGVFDHTFTMNLSQYNVETPPVFDSNVITLDTSDSSGYESVNSKSKTNVPAHKNFFKKPNIAALFKPCIINKRKSNDTMDNKNFEQKNSDYIEMVKECHVYASKIREYKESKHNLFEEYKELPLRILLGRSLVFEDQPIDSTPIQENNASEKILRKENEDGASNNTECFGVNNPFLEDNSTDTEQEDSLINVKVVLSDDALNAESVSYFVPEIFVEPEEKIHYIRSESNSVNNLLSLDDLSKNTPRTVSSDQFVAKKFFDSLLKAYEVEAEVCNSIYEDSEFLSKEVFPIVEKRKQEEKKCKKKGFANLFRRRSLDDGDNIAQETKSTKSILNVEYQSRLQELSSHARKCFCMLADAVKRNKNIDDNEIKFWGLLKMLEKIENGDFQIIQQNDDDLSFKESVKNQVIDSFLCVYEICRKEAKKQRRSLGHIELNLIKLFVSKFRAGLLSNIDIVAIYIGRGQIQSESQLKAAVTFLMRCKSEEINYREFEEYCEIKDECKRK